jgi:tetratricopeptide (TPR) repeat protein
MVDRSVVGRDISQSIVVTGDSNTVTLTFGDLGVVLPLRRRQFRPPDRRHRPAPGEPPRELDLLVPEAGRLPLIGRKDIFVELRAWIDDAVDISVHALIGRAGSGKTRLALEFCALIDNDPIAKGGWLAGFLAPSELTPVVDSLATRHFVWERPTLLVIDYAAQCHEALARWLDRLAGQKLDTKLRILLLDREAPEGFGWWRELTGSGLNTARERRDLFYATRPTQLPDLSDLEERRELIESALQGAHNLRSIPSDGPQIPPAGEDSDFDRALAQPQFGNPLALVMAGVIALDHGARAALVLRHLEAARQLGRRELDRFAALAQSRRTSSNAMRHIVAFNELADGIPIAGLRKSVVEELLASQQSVDLDVVLALLEQELPPRIGSDEAASGTRLATIQPDLIGEAAIIETFTGERSRELEADMVVQRAYTLGGEEAAHVLVRLLQDFAYALEDQLATEQEKETGRRIMGWLLNLAQSIDDPERLLALVFALPEKTTILREPAAELTQRLVTHFRQQAERTNEPAAWITVAALLNNLSNRLSDLGRREDALAAAEEAVRYYRSLAAQSPEAFTPDLGLSLNNLANRLSELGRWEAALAAAEEAVRLRRALAAAHPDAFTADLALSLNNLAPMLSDLGRREEALAAAEEAVGHFRTLAAESPDTFSTYLAGSLNNLAPRLSELGRREEALTMVEEAVRLRRALAAARPDAFTPDLASSLNNLASRLSDLGRRQEALTTAEEAVRLYHALAATRPDAFTPDLALSLNNLGTRLSDLGRREEALMVTEEAVRFYRALAAARPDTFTPDLAGSLSNLGNRLSDFGRPEEALAATEEAVRHYRALAAARPDAFTPDLAVSLNNFGARLGALGRHEEALAAAEEAVQHYRALAAARPDTFTPDLAASLNNLANRLSDLGRREEALAEANEAVHLRRDLAAARPDAFTPDLALSLNNLAVMLSAVGRREEALAAAERAVRLRRALAATQPDAFIPDLALSLNNLANMLSEFGRREEALTTAEEAVHLYRALAAARPDAFTSDLARSLSNLANRLSGLGRRDAALMVGEEAVRLRRALAAARPDAFTPDLALSLNNLANMLSELGRREEALAAAEEAALLYRALASARPDAFAVELVQSLWLLGHLYAETGNPETAMRTSAEAIQLLTPSFVASLTASVGIMAGLVQTYLAQCEVVGREPDAELLGPVVSVFEQLRQREEAG